MLDAKNRLSGKNKKLRIEVTTENNKQYVIYREEAILQIRKQHLKVETLHSFSYFICALEIQEAFLLFSPVTDSCDDWGAQPETVPAVNKSSRFLNLIHRQVGLSYPNVQSDI